VFRVFDVPLPAKQPQLLYVRTDSGQIDKVNSPKEHLVLCGFESEGLLEIIPIRWVCYSFSNLAPVLF